MEKEVSNFDCVPDQQSAVRAPPALQVWFHQTLATPLWPNTDEQLEVACQLGIGILKAVRSRFATSRENRAAYDTLCDDVEEWLRTEITPLRCLRPHRGAD
jgi:hypothetical protein